MVRRENGLPIHTPHLDSPKSRGNYTVGICMRKDRRGRGCKFNGTTVCDRCYRWSEFEPREKKKRRKS